MSARPRRPLRTRLLVAAASCLVSFVLLEVGFRIYEGVQRGRAGELWATWDEDLGYKNNPRYGDHNALGFRDREVEAKDGRFRIVVLGDSVAYYGDDIDDTFPGRLRERLNEAAGTERFDVVNTAVKGWTNWQQVRFLERDGHALRPDLVLISFVLNDCHRTLHAFRVEDGEIVGQNYDFSEEAVASVDSLVYSTLRKSRFLVWLRHQLSSLDAASLSGSDGFSFDYRPDFKTAWMPEAWKRVGAQLGRLRELGVERGFETAIIVFPFGDQYRADYLERDREYVLSPQRELARICEPLGIPLIDPYEELDPETDLEEDGIHLTTAGRGRVVELLTRELSASGVLPGSE